MLSNELARDKDGLLYYNFDDLLSKEFLHIDNRNPEINRYYQHGFYSLDTTKDYIIKYCYTYYTKDEIRRIKEMLKNLISKQKDVLHVDFPIGYVKTKNRLAGLIIKYYENGVSCDNLFYFQYLRTMSKYYHHDEDDLHNLFMLYCDLLDLLYEMFENEIYYVDVNPGNIVLFNNQVKIIDFDPNFVYFDQKDNRLRSIMYGFGFFVRNTLKGFGLLDDVVEYPKDFEKAKTYLKKLEGNIRKDR